MFVHRLLLLWIRSDIEKLSVDRVYFVFLVLCMLPLLQTSCQRVVGRYFSAVEEAAQS